jgi:predicted ATPase/class 3 adenylate cyclase
MISKPSGTVTFLFTDIEGSTRLAQQYPQEMPGLLARHNEILAGSIEKWNGFIFQIVGDSISAAFHSAGDALQAALESQRQIRCEEWSPAPVRVRMGIHTGAAQLGGDDQYTGYAVLAATQRIMSAGHGGQILLSGATRELVRDTLPGGAELQDLGEKRLKDLLRPEHLYQLNGPDAPKTFPPLKTLDSHPNNLPVQLTTFIGREQEMAEVKGELEQHRLVTLTGSGGTGKTRLSLQVAADLLEKFAHGVWFVELAPLSDPALIAQTILSVIGITEQPGRSALEALGEYLHEKQTLIVLDNCEHLVYDCARITQALLNAAPGLRFLASSREALGVRGEAAYPVPSLSLPDLKHLPVVEGLSQYEAVRLFIDRALLVAPHFAVDNDNAPYIAQICYRLDGIPLAIELAAARVRMLSVDQISKRLDDRFRLLTGGARTALPRQQTLRALIDWSYDLLSEPERLLLRRLSVFAGGWTLEAAEGICTGQGIEPFEVLDLLTQLVNKSLAIVLAEGSQSGEVRYRMLETVRQYGREKLFDIGGGESIRGRHLAYFVSLTEQAEPELFRANQVFWLNKLDDELDNLRLALEWALAADVRAGLQMAVCSWQFWRSRGYGQELGDWLGRLLERQEMKDALYARALATYSTCIPDLTRARAIAEQSLQLARSVGDRQVEVWCLLCLGALIALQGNLKEGIPLVEQSCGRYRALGDKLGEATAMGWLVLNQTDLAQTTTVVLESLRLFRELGHLAGIADCINRLALRRIWVGDFSTAAEWLEEAGSLYRRLGDQAGEAETVYSRGSLAYWLGDYPGARAYEEESILLAERAGSQAITNWAHVALAYAILRQGDFSQAREMFRLSIQLFQKTNTLIGQVYALEGAASLHLNQRRPEPAVRLFAWADAMREQIGDRRPPVEQASVERDWSVIRSQLSDGDLARFSEEGRTLTLPQAIALALEE